jgi:cyclopropane fatty-acyl-phospholipid synthase-like methyltransferase
MDKYKETFNTWNNIASLYQEKFMALEVYNDSYDFICNAVDTPKAKLLDIGCGPGNITKYLLSKRPDFDVLGIDIAPNMVALAKQNNPTARFEVMDTRHINTLDATYDGIIAGFCLPYLSQTECDEFIINAYHLLNNHGLIYISFVEGDPATSDYKVGSGGRVYFYYHRLDDLISQLKRYNFGDIQTFKVPYKISETDFDTHTIVVARKRNGL